ncbi:MAG: PLDc N-terminal domain-containing protein [Candidatus Magnetomorum sp.]|nr:PLDc N-terminal domain-containing protein [Candidatus Magnetomorum sp.]
MPKLWFIILIFQVFFAVHAVKTGRRMTWLFIILLFPVVGSIIYFITAMLPDLMENRRIKW